MSIIEKAIDKLGRGTSASPNLNADASSELRARKSPRVDNLATDVTSTSGGAAHKSIKLDFDYLRSVGILTPKDQAALIADQYRRIKRPLLSNAFGKGSALVERGNLIQVASALPNEGKTFTAVNLALSCVKEEDHTVLLVDADVAMSKLSRHFGLEEALGLTDVLSGVVRDLGDVMVTTDVPGLTVLPAGTHSHHAAELLASRKMERLVEEIAKRHPERIVIFDSPPLLATAESQVLAGLMGQIVLVVAAETTPQHAVKEAVATLDISKAIGIVFNKSFQYPGSDYYGGYYGHGHQ